MISCSPTNLMGYSIVWIPDRWVKRRLDNVGYSSSSSSSNSRSTSIARWWKWRRHHRPDPAVNQQGRPANADQVLDIWLSCRLLREWLLGCGGRPPQSWSTMAPHRRLSKSARPPLRTTGGTNALIYRCLSVVFFRSSLDAARPTPRTWSPLPCRRRTQPSHVFPLVPPTAPDGRDVQKQR